MKGILLFWIIPILIPVDIPPGHLILLLGTNMTQEYMNVIISTHTLSILSGTPFFKKHDQQSTTIDYDKLKPYFGWVNAETIKRSFENSTQ